jgi:hypothetical protein
MLIKLAMLPSTSCERVPRRKCHGHRRLTSLVDVKCVNWNLIVEAVDSRSVPDILHDSMLTDEERSAEQTLSSKSKAQTMHAVQCLPQV